MLTSVGGWLTSLILMIRITPGYLAALTEQDHYVHIAGLDDTGPETRGIGESAFEEFPENLQVEFKLHSEHVTLNLRRNKHVNMNAPVTFLGEGEKQKRTMSNPLQGVAVYLDVASGATISVVARMMGPDTEAYLRVMEGSFGVGGKRFGIEPASATLVKLDKMMMEERTLSEEQKGRLYRVYAIDTPRVSRRSVDYVQLNIPAKPDGVDALTPTSEDSNTDPSASSSSSEVKEDDRELELLLKELYDELREKNTREKREVEEYASYHVEIALLLDHTIWEFWMEQTDGDSTKAELEMKYYFTHIMNGINLVYESIDSTEHGIRITPWLKEYIIGRTRETSPWTVDNIMGSRGSSNRDTAVNASRVLSSLGDIHTLADYSWYNPDHLMLFTKYDLDGDGTIGYAPVGGICYHKYSVSVSEDLDFHSWGTAAHELGHNLGSSHDGSGNACDPALRYVMNPGGGNVEAEDLPNSYTFSDCSIKAFLNTLRGTAEDKYPRVCVYNQICDHSEPLDDVDVLPGARLTITEQCQLYYGEDSYFCTDVTEEVCSVMHCNRVYRGERACWTSIRAAEGTNCGQDKWCLGGSCVSRESNPPPQSLSSDTCQIIGLPNNVPEGCIDTGRFSGSVSTCAGLVEISPHSCFTWTYAIENCCASCHRLGLIHESTDIVMVAVNKEVDGSWGGWSSWSSCSDTCGSGSRSRSRDCDDPPPGNGGQDCIGDVTDVRACDLADCPVDGAWGDWGEWGACSVTCGSGSASRLRSCDSPSPGNGGDNCPGDASQDKLCTEGGCPVDGAWTTWGTWSACSMSCGSGQRARQRACTNPPPENGGKECTGSVTSEELCSDGICPVDGGWSEWTDWSACSVTCEEGSQTRSRACDNPAPSDGGVNCGGPADEVKPCQNEHCPVNGVWSVWSGWSSCSLTCGTGHSTRTRQCDQPPPEHQGLPCSGEDEQQQACHVKGCPVDGSWSDWGLWTDCSVTCGEGQTSRSRQCSQPSPAEDGLDCPGEVIEVKGCQIQSCPTEPAAVDGAWSDWGLWSPCSRTCEGGIQSRTRICDNPDPDHGGDSCSGSSEQRQLCNNQRCPVDLVDGGWSGWESWASCSVTCGQGVRSRERHCDNPVAANGGSPCQGLDHKEDACLQDPCPSVPCTDALGDICDSLATFCDSNFGGVTINRYCASTCGLCQASTEPPAPPTQPACVDELPIQTCQSYAKWGWCDMIEMRDYFKEYCALSCEYCPSAGR